MIPDRTSAVTPRPGLTLVTPSFEKHFVQFQGMLRSLVEHCQDLEFIHLTVVVERANEARFAAACRRHPGLSWNILLTEDVLADFGATEAPDAFLKRIGKFTFQTLKKFGGLLRAKTDWSLVLDSEGLFQNPFRAKQLLEDYAAQKYVFYTRTQPRGPLWCESTGFDVTSNAAAALSVTAGDRWYMEYFHWFYETAKVKDLIHRRLGPAFYDPISNPSYGKIDYFENIIYYLYLEHHHGSEYEFIDFKSALDRLLPETIAARFKLDELPFSLFGNEYLLNILSAEEIRFLAPLFEAYKLPFVRLEPPSFSAKYLPELRKLPHFVATISSHHMTWLRKKIAVCISGEFRHAVHRAPEHHVRHLLGFLSGVECDIYLHGWSNASEALIVDQLRPRAHVFEPRPSFVELGRRIRTTEPNIKPGRDEGSLAMFYGISEAYKLMEPNIAEYDYVLRIRPDLYSDLSLKEILVKISDEGDLLPETIYVPRHFHSKGLNDQLALGPVHEMGVYARTFEYVEANVSRLFFNPESILLRNLVENEVQIATCDMPYALMRNEPLRINSVHEHFHRQFGVWWSRTDDLPPYEDLSAYFADKLWAMEAIMRGVLPEVLHLRVPAEGGGEAVIRAEVVDNDPALHATALIERLGLWLWSPFEVADGMVREARTAGPRQVFVYRDAGEVVLVEWRMRGGRFSGERLVVAGGRVSPGDPAFAGAGDAMLPLAAADSGAGEPATMLVRRADANRSTVQVAPAPRRIQAAGRLAADQELAAGACLRSRDGAFELRLQVDGDLRLQAAGAAEPLWSTGATGRPGRLTMQADGNLVLYGATGAAAWASDTSASPSTELQVGDDGVLRLLDGARILWSRPEMVAAADVAVQAVAGFPSTPVSSAPIPSTQAPGGDAIAAGRLDAGMELTADGGLSSPDGSVTLRLRAGRLVLDGEAVEAGFEIEGARGIARLVMQYDGNLVGHDRDEAPVWASNTAGWNGAYLAVRNEGRAAVVRGDEIAWLGEGHGEAATVANPASGSEPPRVLQEAGS